MTPPVVGVDSEVLPPEVATVNMAWVPHDVRSERIHAVPDGVGTAPFPGMT